jgi:rfaE bifunctional protein kinase chain/domain/rfaE bifunctional protein nucleotidyltransferase chain/domain
MENAVGTSLGKIRDLQDLSGVVGALKAQGKKVVHCHGVYDLLHLGHIRHFNQAKTLGDVLVVTITPDKHVNKGPSRPAFTQDLRAEAISALDCVDYVAINQWPTAVETIKLLHPNYYVKGSDYRDPDEDLTGGIAHEERAIQSVGGQISFTDEITFSSSNLINRHMEVFPEETRSYLSDFSSRYSSDQVIGYLDGARALKVLVIGETIIDEYLYCETIGKSGKEPILAAKHLDSEKFAGGIVAVANNVSAFTDDSAMLTFLGGVDSQEDFVRENVNSNVEKIFLPMADNAPTIVKRRFVEKYPFQKLFELYVMNDGEYNPAETEDLCLKLQEILPRFDVVLVLDYGHGMLAPEAVELICSQAKFLAINTQMNAGNRGFNTVSKYRRADFICVSEAEIRLEARSRRRDLREIVVEVSDNLSCDRVLITLGEKGCLCYDRNEGFSMVPAFATKVVDRVGAGDWVFSVASLCVAQGAPLETVGFIGNAAGAEAVATVGHRRSIERVPLYRHIESLLK